jgi:4-diphosphocytidyl-2-C-methyl-D-erythritol kinase
MTQIDLWDDIYIDFSQKELSITCDHPDVPSDESNLAYKAVVLFYHWLKIKYGKEKKGLFIEIKKRIPPGGGLGGGSSNAAALLIILNNYHKRPFSKAELMEMGLTLGADVPFFIFGNSAIAKGVGERLERVPNLRPYHLVLCDPGIAASTANVYKNIDFRLTLNQKYNMNTGLNVLLGEQEFDARDQMHNDLEESACRLYPEIKETKEEMESLLRRRVVMTGSGSSLFALFSARDNANRGYEMLLKKWTGSKRKVFLSSFNKNL